MRSHILLWILAAPLAGTAPGAIADRVGTPRRVFALDAKLTKARQIKQGMK